MELFSGRFVTESKKELFTQTESSWPPKAQTWIITKAGTGCCWKRSAVRTPVSLIPALLTSIRFSFCVFCVYIFWWRQYGIFLSEKWALKFRFAKYVKGSKTCFPSCCSSWCWQQITVPSSGLSSGRNDHRSCANGSRESSRRLCLPYEPSLLASWRTFGIKSEGTQFWKNFR